VLLAAALVALRAGVAIGQEELVVNGGFEFLNEGEWHISPAGDGAFITNGPAAQAGVGYLSMGNVNGANQAVFQTVILPTNLISAVFSFDYEIARADTVAGDDVLSVYIRDTNQNVLAFLGSINNLAATNPPAYFHVATNLAAYTGQTNLSSYAGRAVQLYFKVTTDLVSGSQTTFDIDNVSILIGTTADIPANDNFANSITLQTNATITATNTFASREPGEPSIAGNAGGH